jgi:hypothetical protein
MSSPEMLNLREPGSDLCIFYVALFQQFIPMRGLVIRFKRRNGTKWIDPQGAMEYSEGVLAEGGSEIAEGVHA